MGQDFLFTDVSLIQAVVVLVLGWMFCGSFTGDFLVHFCMSEALNTIVNSNKQAMSANNTVGQLLTIVKWKVKALSAGLCCPKAAAQCCCVLCRLKAAKI